MYANEPRYIIIGTVVRCLRKLFVGFVFFTVFVVYSFLRYFLTTAPSFSFVLKADDDVMVAAVEMVAHLKARARMMRMTSSRNVTSSRRTMTSSAFMMGAVIKNLTVRRFNPYVPKW